MSEQPISIIIVEDEPEFRRRFVQIVENEPSMKLVGVAPNKREAQAIIDRDNFDVMLIDVFMPHMRGLESVRMFHERRPEIPVVAMSGYAFANTERAPDFLRMAIELGAACCLRKPFTPDALLTSVNQCITTPKASVRHSK